MSGEQARPGGAQGVMIGFITAPEGEAERIARVLLEERLAACCNVLPGVVSHFRWKGKIEREAEALILVKTTREVSRDLVAKVREIHTYDVPEVVLLDVGEGLEEYLQWVTMECSLKKEG